MHRFRQLANLIFLGWILFFTSVANSVSLPTFGNVSASTLITTDNVPNPWTYGVNLTNLQIYLKTTLSSANAIKFQIQNSQGERSISYQVQGASNSEGVVSGNVISYPDVFDYTNITYTIGPSELSKVITISNESAPTNFTFKLQISGVNYTQTSSGGVTFIDETTGEQVWSIAPPNGFDSTPTVLDDNTLNVSSPKLVHSYYTIRKSGPNLFLDLTINETNMSQFTYPIFIDPTTQSACGTLSASGEYELNQSVTTTSTCFTIDADDIVLDCRNYNITGDGGFSDYGINVATQDNVTIKNCNLYNFGAAIRLTTSNNSLVENNTVNNSYYYGIYLTTSDNNTIRNNTANSSKYGTYLTSSDDNNLTNNTFKSQEYYGLYLEYSQGNRIINNTAQESGTLDFLNSASSTDYCNNQVSDLIGSGGLPVNYTNSSVTWGNFTASEIFLCNADNSIFTNLTITGSLTLYNNALFSYFTDSSLFTNLTSNENKYGVYIAAYPNTEIAVNYNNITSSTFFNNSNGIYLASANYSTVSGNTIANNTDGIVIDLVFLSNFTSNLLENNSDDAFYVEGSNNLFENNSVFSNGDDGFEFYKPTSLDKGRYNTIRYNNVSYNNDKAFHIRSGAYYNTISSNYIANNSYGGYLNAGFYTNFTNNTIINYLNSAFFLTSSDENNFFNNTLSDTDNVISFAIHLSSSSDRNVFDNNTISWRASTGFYLSPNVVGNRITNNKILTGSSYGIYGNSSHSNISYNKIDNTTQWGIYLTGDNNTLAYNNVSNVTGSTLGASFFSYNGADNNTFISNLAIDSLFHGFWFNSSNNATLTNNNVTNSTTSQYYFNSNSNATFTGNNYATSPYSLSTNDIIIANGSNVTTLYNGVYYNFSSDHLSLFFNNAINVSIQTLNLTNSGASALGCANSSYPKCTLVTNNLSVVNITNNSATGTIGLGFYYNLSTGLSNIFISNYSSGWDKVGSTLLNTTVGSVRLDGITSFSTFGAADFATTYYVNITAGSGCVPADTSSHSSIQGAVNNASSGNIVYVCYDGGVVHNQSTTVVVNRPLNIHGKQNGVIVNLSSSNTNNVINISANFVNISNFTIVNASGSGAAGIFVNYNNSRIYGNILRANYFGIYINNSHHTVFNNTAYNNSGAGFGLYSSSSNNTISNNTGYNTSQSAFFLQTSSNNTFTNNIGYNNNFSFNSDSSSNNNTFTNNSAYNNTNNGFSFSSSSSNNTLSNNTAYNNSAMGFVFESSSSNEIVHNNTAYNNNFFGYSFSSSSNNNITNNTGYNNSYYGFNFESSSSNNTLSNNTAYNNTRSGFNFESSSLNNTLSINAAYNNSEHGFAFDSSSNNTLTNNTAYNNTYNGFNFESSSSNNSVTNNTAYLNLRYGFAFDSGSNDTLNTNTAYNNSQYGFYFTSETLANLSGNNATNNTLAQYHFNNANVTFTGINRALLTPSAGLDLNITNGSNVTTLVSSTYNNFTTTYGTIFFDNAINVSVKLMNLSDSGAASSGCSVFTGTCTLLTPSTNVVNISNASAPGTIILGMFYNLSTNPTSSNLYIGKYNNGWNQVGQTHVDTSAGSVRYGAITSFSTFGIVNFVASTPSPPSDNSPVKSLEIDYDFTCSDGSLEVSTTKGAEVSLVELSPNYIQLEKKEADAEGNVLFTITEDGTYKIRATKSGYTSDEKNNLEFNLCEETPEEDGEEPEPEPQPEQPPEQLECNVDSDCEEGYGCTDNNCVLKSTPEPPPPDNSQSETLEGLNSAQQQLDQAKKEGKDVAEAQKKLDEARKAYEEGDYERAKQLLSGVESFIMESLKFEDDKTIVTQPKQDEKKESEKQEEDISLLLIFSVVAIAGLSLLTVIYFFSKKK